MVSKYQAMESNMGPTGEVGTMKDNITDLQKQLQELREAKKLQSQAYSKLMEARQKVRWAGFMDQTNLRMCGSVLEMSVRRSQRCISSARAFN